MNKKILHSVFESVAARRAAHTAIITSGSRIAYEHLNSYANAIANALIACGVKRGNPVGLYLESSINYVAAMLGTMKSAGVFMPMEVTTPVNRLSYILKEAAPEVLITTPALLPGLLEAGIKGQCRVILLGDETNGVFTVLCPGTGEKNEQQFSTEPPAVEFDGNDSCYIMFTSGSTGTPKAIEGLHKSLSHFIHWEIGALALDEKTRVSQLAPVSFDVSLRDIFVPLIAGGTLCIPEKHLKANIPDLVQWMRNESVTLVHCVPSVFRLLSEGAARLTSVRHILLAGEPLYGKDVNRWRKSGGSQQLLNLYGPSETTLAKLYYRIPSQVFEDHAIIPIGTPISNTVAIVLKNGKLCPAGEIGELYIKTPFRSRGYFNDPQQTAARFIQNPLHKDEADIVYRTGDLVRYMSDQNIEFIGREDYQLKVNGNRVELAEIEKVLLQLPQIREIAVIPVQKDQEVQIGCYYTAVTDPGRDAIIKHLKAWLPEYMLPTYFMRLDVFPLNINGKIDRKALPPFLEESTEEFVAASTELELRLEKIFSEILKVNKIGIHASFFEMGGSSLKAIQIISRIYKECGILIKLPDFFANPAISKLTGLLQQQLPGNRTEISALPQKPHYEVSGAQRRIWILDQFTETGAAYNTLSAYQLNGTLNTSHLENAFNKIIERHESLRSVFRMEDNEVRQIIRQPFDLKIAHADLCQYDGDKEDMARGIAMEESLRAFSISEGPLIRVKLVKMDTNVHLLFISMHHIISDGWSVQVLLQELMQLYNAYENGIPDPLPALHIQYKDYVAWYQTTKAEEHKRNKAYWGQRFADGVPVLELPADRRRPAVKTYEGRQIAYYMDERQVHALKQLAQQTGTTLFMNFLSVINILLYKYSGKTDMVLGTPVAGRDHQDLEDLIGVFINTIAIRTTFSPQDTYLSLLQQVKKDALEAFAHQDYPFDDLINDIDIQRDISRSPLFDVMITYGSVSSITGKLQNTGHLQLVPFAYDHVISRFDISFTFLELEDHIRVQIEYNNALFSDSFMQRLNAHLNTLLQQVLLYSGIPLIELDLLSERERKVLLTRSCATQQGGNLTTIDNLFEISVAKNPEAIALRDQGVSLTYASLNIKANQVAYHLRYVCELKAGEPVALFMPKSADMIVSILGILKAGGHYVPVDMTYPSQRISYLLSDTAAKIVITTHELKGKIQQVKQCICLADIDNRNEENIQRLHTPTHPAYVIYTSGSTGTPKGVVMQHAAVYHLHRGLEKEVYSRYNAPLQVAMIASCVFDASVQQIFPALFLGHTLHLVPDDIKSDGDLLWKFYCDHRIEITDGTPAHLFLLSHAALPAGNSNPVRHFLIGGDVLHTSMVEALRKVTGQPYSLVTNLYGPTECCVDSTAFTIQEEDLDTEATLPIGKPLQDKHIYILGPNLELLPENIPGEICIGGQGIAAGYLHQKEMTEKQFVQDPFAEGIMYRTGDIGRWLPDGNIAFLGRHDNQVKIRGYRIETGEIVQALLQHEQINSAVVVVRENELIAYFTSNEPGLDPTEHLKHYLPAYMIPAVCIWIQSVPLNESGKTDVAKLPDPHLLVHTKGPEYVAPRTPTEQKLVNIWESVLGRHPIGVHDLFFDVGGHSLKAVQITARIHEELGIKISLRSIFQSPTIEGIATEIEAIQWVHSSAAGQDNGVYTQEITL